MTVRLAAFAMSPILSRITLLGVALVLAACGGGGDSVTTTNTSTTTTSTTSSVATSTTVTTSTAIGTTTYVTLPLTGITYVLAAGNSVHVPPGTTLVGTGGASMVVNGNNAVIYVPGGTALTVPKNAGAATNLVTTSAAPYGALSLNSPSVTAIAGSATLSGTPTDGVGVAAVLGGDARLAVSPWGVLYAADAGGLRSVSIQGTVTSVLTPSSPLNWHAAAADVAGNVFLQGLATNAPAGRAGLSIFVRNASGVVSSLIDNWTTSPTPDTRWGRTGIALGADGTLYAIDPGSHAVFRFSSTGAPVLIAGSALAGYQDGVGGAARFSRPTDLAVDKSGNVYVADTGNHAVRKITPGGTVSTIALTGNAGPIAVDAAGMIYCMGSEPATLVRIRPDLTVVTSIPLSNITGTVTGLAADPYGNVYVAARTATGGARIYTVYF